jgi:hypothetical protein
LSYQIIDDFLENPEEIRKFATESIFYPPSLSDNWLGFRSKMFDRKQTGIVGDLVNKIYDCLCEKFYTNKNNVTISGYFHYSPEISQLLVGDVFHDYKFHRDYKSHYAGVLYLTPNPPENSGTSFITVNKHFHLQNKYNRIILYDSSILHAPTSFFGDTINDGRLTFVFFSEKTTIPEIFTSNSNNIFNLK